jgi:hypothetical protein
MERLYLMLLTLTVSTFFLMVPDTGPDRFNAYKCPHCSEVIQVDTWELPEDSQRVEFFPFSDKKLFIDTYVFLLCVHLIHVGMSVVILKNEIELQRIGMGFVAAAGIFLAIHAVDTIFYLLSYGEPFKQIKLTWNITKICIFAYAIRKEATRH